MAGIIDPFDSGIVDPFENAQPAAPVRQKRKVGAGEAFLRELGGAYADTANMLGMAAGGAARIGDVIRNLFTGRDDTTMQDWVFKNVVDDVTRNAVDYYRLKDDEEYASDAAQATAVGGRLAGIVQQAIAASPSGALSGTGPLLSAAARAGAPLEAAKIAAPAIARGAASAAPSFALPGAVTRAQDMIDAGVDEDTMMEAFAVNAAGNTAMGALPVSVPGNLFTRAATGAALNAAAGAATREAEAAVLGDEYANLATDAGEGLKLDAGIGAVLAALFGGRGMPAVQRINDRMSGLADTREARGEQLRNFTETYDNAQEAEAALQELAQRAAPFMSILEANGVQLTDPRARVMIERLERRLAEQQQRQGEQLPIVADEEGNAFVADAGALAGRAEAEARESGEVTPNRQETMERTIRRQGLEPEQAEEAFTIASLRQNRADADLARRGELAPDYQAGNAAATGGRFDGGIRNVTLLDARFDRRGRPVAGESVTVIGTNGSNVVVEDANGNVFEVKSNRLFDMQIPANMRMAQDFIARSSEPPRGVGEETMAGERMPRRSTDRIAGDEIGGLTTPLADPYAPEARPPAGNVTVEEQPRPPRGLKAPRQGETIDMWPETEAGSATLSRVKKLTESASKIREAADAVEGSQKKALIAQAEKMEAQAAKLQRHGESAGQASAKVVGDSELSARIELNRGLFESYLPDMDWSEQGGRIIRDPETGEVTGRTQWVPRDPDIDAARLAAGVSYSYMRKAVQKALDGKKLSAKERRAVEAVMDVFDLLRESGAEYHSLNHIESPEDIAALNRILNELADENRSFDDDYFTAAENREGQAAETSGYEPGADPDEAPTYRQDGKGADNQAGETGGAQPREGAAQERPQAELQREGVDRSRSGKGAGVQRAMGGGEQDLLGDDTATRQAVADAERAKDAKRNSGDGDSSDFVLTGSDRPADQAAARGARDLFEAGGNDYWNDPKYKDTPLNARIPFESFLHNMRLRWGDLQLGDRAGEMEEMRLEHLDFIETALEGGKAVPKQVLDDHDPDPKQYPLAYELKTGNKAPISKFDAAMNKLDELELDPDLNKSLVRALANQLLKDGIITVGDYKEVDTILRDRDMAAEDALGELRSSVLFNSEISGSNKLYSFPGMLFDPDMWAKLAKDAGFATKKLTQAVQDGLGWGREDAAWWIKGIKRSTDLVTQAKDPRKREAMGSLIRQIGRNVFQAYGSRVNTLAEMSGSETFKRMIRNLYTVAGDRSGSDLGLEHRQEVEFASREKAYAKQIDRLDQLIKEGRLTNDVWARVADLVRNPSRATAGTPVGDAALAIRKFFDDTLKYMRESGVDIGEVREGYYPREFDVTAIQRAPEKFKRALTQAYIENGVSADEAPLMADDMYASLIVGRESLFQSAVGKARAPFLKGRVFNKGVDKADHPLNEFLISDPRVSLPAYLQRAVRRAELSRFMKESVEQIVAETKGKQRSQALQRHIDAAKDVPGDSLENWQVIRQKLLDDGVHEGAIDELADYINTITGMKGSSGWLAGTTSWVRTMTTMALLEKATLSSLGEVFMPAIRSGNVLDLHRSLATTAKALIRRNSDDIKGLTELAEDLGIISSTINDVVMANRWGGGDFQSVEQSRILSNNFRMTGLTQWTDATRLAGVRIGQTFVRRMAKQVVKDSRLATDNLAELGVPKDKAKDFANWLLKNSDGLLSADDLRAAPPEMRSLYMRVLQKFDYQTIMRPNKSSRPRWATDGIGAMIFQLQSYNYAFFENVWKRGMKNAWQAVTNENQYTAIERMKLAAPLLMMPTLVAAQAAVGELRDALLGDPDKKKTTQEKVFTALSRGVPVAPIDPLLNVVTGARFNRTSSEVLAGPALGTIGKAVDAGVAATVRNSDKTNTAERAAAKASYDAFIEPAAAIVLANLYAEAPLAAKVAIAGARQVAGSGRFREEAFVEPVAGAPKKRSGSSQAPAY
jgi:hypothetical protein